MFAFSTVTCGPTASWRPHLWEISCSSYWDPECSRYLPACCFPELCLLIICLRCISACMSEFIRFGVYWTRQMYRLMYVFKNKIWEFGAIFCTFLCLLSFWSIHVCILVRWVVSHRPPGCCSCFFTQHFCLLLRLDNGLSSSFFSSVCLFPRFSIPCPAPLYLRLNPCTELFISVIFLSSKVFLFLPLYSYSILLIDILLWDIFLLFYFNSLCMASFSSLAIFKIWTWSLYL